MTVYNWSTTAASNDTADSTINWREAQAPSTVNDSARAMMAAIAKWRDDQSGNLVTGGTSTAYTLTTNQVFTALTDGISVTCRMSATNGASPTLNVDSLGARSIASVYGTAVQTGALKSGGIYTFTYDSTDNKWIVHGLPDRDVPSGSVMLFYSASAPVGWTISDADTDKAIRVVSGASGAGGASGGTTPFSLVLASRTITQANLPSYTLPDTIAASTTTTLTNGTLVHRAGTATDLGGGSGAGYIDIARATITASSTTTITGSVTSGGSGTAMDFAVQYISVIKATRA